MTAQQGYLFYEFTVEEMRDEGLIVATPAGTKSDPGEAVRWSSPSGERVVHWLVASRGIPEAPAAKSLSGGYVLVSSAVKAALPVPTWAKGKGSQLWVLSGVYVYDLLLPREPDSDLPLGAMPDPIDSLADVQINTIPAGQFLRSLLNNAQPPGLHANPPP